MHKYEQKTCWVEFQHFLQIPNQYMPEKNNGIMTAIISYFISRDCCIRVIGEVHAQDTLAQTPNDVAGCLQQPIRQPHRLHIVNA